MTALVFKLTDAGRAAFVNPSNTGTAARTVVSVGITATPFAPTAALAAVPNEIKRLTTISGAAVGDDTVHVTIRDESADVYSARGFGLYLDNGVLLGTYSQPAVIVEKSAGALMLLSTDLRFIDSAVPASAIQFGNADFMNPPATTQTQGVVQLATADEAVAGVDGSRAITPLALAAVANLLMQAISTRAPKGTTLAAYGITDAYTAAAVDQLLAGKAAKGTTLGAYGITDAYTKTAVDQALAAKANKGTTLGAYGITDAAPGDHVGATGNAHGAATSAVSGFMSAADKAKLDGIQGGAQVNTVTAVAGKTGAVTLAKADVGLGNVDNTADNAKAVASAAKLTTARKINGTTFDGTQDIVVTDDTKLPKSGGDVGALRVRSNGSGVDIGGSSTTGAMTVRGASNGAGLIDFTPADFDNTQAPYFFGRAFYDFTTNCWDFYTASKFALRVDATGRLLVGTKVATPVTTIRQIIAGPAEGNGAYSQWSRTAGTVGGAYAGTDGSAFIAGVHTGALGAEGYTELLRALADGTFTFLGKQVLTAPNFAASLAPSGWQKLSSGLIVQWATYSGLAGGDNTVAWPISFPNLCFGGLACWAYSFSTNSDAGVGLSAAYTTGGKIRSAFGGATAFVLVIGN